jgi:hypothetical protein
VFKAGSIPLRLAGTGSCDLNPGCEDDAPLRKTVNGRAERSYEPTIDPQPTREVGFP